MESRPQTLSLSQAMELALAHHHAGRLSEAEKIYRKVLEVRPEHAEALDLLGVLLHQRGENDQGVELIGRAVRLQPSNPDYLSDLGTVRRALRQWAPAEESLRSALTLAPESARTHHELGNVLRERRRTEEAIEHYRRAIAIDTDYADAHNNLGTALANLGQPQEAEQSYRRALALKPDFPEALGNLGSALMEGGRLEEAEACLRRAAALNPEVAEVHNNLGNALNGLGRYAEAEPVLRRALALRPDFAEAHNNLGRALNELGRAAEALPALHQALALKPDLAGACLNLGNSYVALGHPADAERSLRRALELKPEDADAHNNLGALLCDLERFEEAEKCYRRALSHRHDYVNARNNMGNLLRNLGRLEEAQQVFREILAANPDHAVCHSNLIFTIDLMERSGMREQQAERRRWHEAHAERHASANRHGNRPDPERRLRVGYVSADFRLQSACMIFAPVLLGHDRAQVEVVCYSGTRREDEVTARLRAAAALWRPTLGVPDDALAEQIRRDGIDILVDLSGHMAGNRLLVFARKPAPVQVTAWGYANGTGLQAMDYFLADAVLVPREERHHFAEEVVDLPCCVCYKPPPYLPAVTSLPAQRGGPITFGCLNRLEKISDRAISLWGRILEAVAQSRLLLKDRGLGDAGLREFTLLRLARSGIGKERVRLLEFSPHSEHLKSYGDIDVGLDPYPHGGGVSTVESLWMGVPVVTLEGATVPSRLSASILTAAQMPEWIARSDDEYVRIAVSAANDLARLAAIRRGLRARMESSVVGDTERYTRAVEEAYRTMWRRWCERQAGGRA